MWTSAAMPQSRTPYSTKFSPISQTLSPVHACDKLAAYCRSRAPTALVTAALIPPKISDVTMSWSGRRDTYHTLSTHAHDGKKPGQNIPVLCGQAPSSTIPPCPSIHSPGPSRLFKGLWWLLLLLSLLLLAKGQLGSVQSHQSVHSLLGATLARLGEETCPFPHSFQAAQTELNPVF